MTGYLSPTSAPLLFTASCRYQSTVAASPSTNRVAARQPSSCSIRVGSTGLLADVSEETPVAIDAVMANLGGTVLRRSASDVQAEVAAAEEAQREAKKQARKELRDARHKKQKAEINAKLTDLRAKLDRHNKSAATS